ncbi:MAG TPA: acyloxyacyl hydrolase [Nitrospirota bacterium]|nr:acyloxyacyl hydrolase [Nitrospirota bacterium]
MKLRITLVAFFFFIFYAWTACANGLFLEAGPGVISSQGSTYTAVRYQKETSKLFDTDSFYEITYASWNGPNNNNALSFARGLRWTVAANTYGSADFGVGHINRTTANLGTPFQFYFRFAFGIKVGSFDLSLGFVHYSNGKLIFNWPGPNNGEDFPTFSLGITF